MSFATDATPHASRLDRALKRGFDVLLAGTGLVVSAPVWLAAALAIALEDGFPVFFRQQRWGQGGRTFWALKFRSMWRSPRGDGSVQATADDPRITRVGRVMRACALDELPQLWNIFVGDMSFVGPRALPMNERQASGRETDIPDEQVPGFRERLAVRPGLTGIAQVYADRDAPRAVKFRYDRFYIRRQSFWLDLRLIAVSFYISFLGRWETRGDKLRRPSAARSRVPEGGAVVD
jgi:lipopolysaccharide/colanic/teichoic acid biosynthesis glycosyltransferase